MSSSIYADEAFDQDIPSTRVNTHIWNRYNRVDSTLAVAGTAENLFSIGSVLHTVNIATNPSFETGAPPTGYTLVGSALAQSAVVARTGTNSIRVTPDNVAAGEGFYWETPSIAGGSINQPYYLVASAYFNDNAGSSNGARLIIASSIGATLATGNTVTLAASWGRSVVRYPLPNIAATYRVYAVTATQFATVFYTDDFQSELRRDGNVTDYCDGSLGIGYAWDGTANASISRRAMSMQAVKGYEFHCTGDVYVSEDVNASSTTGVYRRAGSDWWNEWPVDIQRISFVNVNVGETPRVFGKIYGVHIGKR